MKALLKIVVVGLVVVLVSGCLAGCAGSVQGRAGPALGHNGHMSAGHGGGVRVPPCEPFYADSLMSWATELDGKYQQRQANVTNSNGRVNCRATEQAGSRSNDRQHAVPSGNYRQSNSRENEVRQVHRAPSQTEPEITGWGR